MIKIKAIALTFLVCLSLDCTNKAESNNNYNKPDFVGGASLTGTRSRANIMKGIMYNLGKMRNAYEKEYKGNTERVVILAKITINAEGNVTDCQIVKTNSNDKDFDQKLIEIIKLIQFGKDEGNGQNSYLTYPFVFSR